MKFFPYILLFIAFGFTACNDVIDVELEEGGRQLVVDAFINDLAQEQVVKLRYTDAYFSNRFAPTVPNAQVTITSDGGEVYNFEDPDNDGDYTWTPTGSNTFGARGESYTLNIELEGITYTAESAMNRVPPIDSIVAEFRDDEFGEPDGYYAEFFSVDFSGEGDCYWIKAYKNGIFLNKPQELNLAFDAGFTEGSNVDGLAFIQPIAEFINPVPDEDEEDDPPYAIGDSIRVEIHSITLDVFRFMEQLRTQTTLGDAGIFAEPSTNVPTNISTTSPDERPQGFFSVSSVSSAEIEVKE